MSVGKSCLPDGILDKVNGKAIYTDDIKLDGMVFCKILGSPHAHAIVKSIDFSEALKVDGVLDILTSEDLPVPFGVLPIREDEYPLARPKVRHIGDHVVAVAGVTERVCEEAIRKIRVEYELLKEISSPEDGLKVKDVLIHEDKKEHNNIDKEVYQLFGDIKKAEALSEVVVKGHYSMIGLNHCVIEPHAAVAYIDNDSTLVLISTTQIPHYVHRQVAKCLNLPMESVRVIKPYLGSGFGGKSEIFAHEIIVAAFALRLKKPVKIRLNREEIFALNRGRHPYEIDLEIGASREGKLFYIRSDQTLDGGAYGGFGVVTVYYSGSLLAGPYKIEAMEYKGKRVFTNKPACGAQRGHGGVNPRLAFEILLDELSERLDMDPFELRLKNLLPANCETINNLRITSNGLKECIERVMSESRWKERYKNMPDNCGLGCACSWYISGAAYPVYRTQQPHSTVDLELKKDGKIQIRTQASDIGQGSNTVLRQIVAEATGARYEDVKIYAADTAKTPMDLGSYSSRVTFMAGNAALMASLNLKKRILEMADSAGLKVVDIRDSSLLDSSYKNVISLFEFAQLISEKGLKLPVSTGSYKPPKLGGKYRGAGVGPSPSYSFGAAVAEVEVDSITGRVFVKEIWLAHDCGKAINPEMVKTQLEGSMIFAVGQALYERFSFIQGCVPANSDMLEYKIPVAADIGKLNPIIVESVDPEGPFGAKEVGEGGVHPVVPAIVNAISRAVGKRFRHTPVTAEDILEALG